MEADSVNDLSAVKLVPHRDMPCRGEKTVDEFLLGHRLPREDRFCIIKLRDPQFTSHRIHKGLLDLVEHHQTDEQHHQGDSPTNQIME